MATLVRLLVRVRLAFKAVRIRTVSVAPQETRTSGRDGSSRQEVATGQATTCDVCDTESASLVSPSKLSQLPWASPVVVPSFAVVAVVWLSVRLFVRLVIPKVTPSTSPTIPSKTTRA
jgi:hypothetical protein